VGDAVDQKYDQFRFYETLYRQLGKAGEHPGGDGGQQGHGRPGAGTQRRRAPDLEIA
jgi:hypothetical protein